MLATYIVANQKLNKKQRCKKVARNVSKIASFTKNCHIAIFVLSFYN